jgi:hypothetical protein
LESGKIYKAIFIQEAQQMMIWRVSFRNTLADNLARKSFKQILGKCKALFQRP